MNIKQKICLASGLIVIIVILLIGFFVRPLLKEIKSTSLSIEDKEEKLAILKQSDQSYLEQLEVDYEDVKEEISLIESGFLINERVVDFIVELENFASSTSNILEIRKADYPFFSLRLKGSFSNLMRYLGWLENGYYFVNIDSVKISRVIQRETPLSEPGEGFSVEVEAILEISIPAEI